LTFHYSTEKLTFHFSTDKTIMSAQAISSPAKRRLTQGVQDAAVACSYYNFLCRFLRTWEPQALMDVIKMKKLIERWKSSSRSCYLKLFLSLPMSHKFRIGNIFSLLREVETQDMVRSLLRDWQIRTLKDYVFELSGVSNDENYVPIRPTEKKKYRCGHCGMKNDHYITTCPIKKLGYVRNPKTGRMRKPRKSKDPLNERHELRFILYPQQLHLLNATKCY